VEWLKERLKDGPVYVGDIKSPEPGTIRAYVKDAGMSWMTIRRAMEQLGVISERCPFTKKFQWRFPKTDVVQDPLHTNNVSNMNNMDNSTERPHVSPTGNTPCSSCENVNNVERERGEL
jgi:hypothetical protein